jgi:hypothetical protein
MGDARELGTAQRPLDDLPFGSLRQVRQQQDLGVDQEEVPAEAGLEAAIDHCAGAPCGVDQPPGAADANGEPRVVRPAARPAVDIVEAFRVPADRHAVSPDSRARRSYSATKPRHTARRWR